MEYSKLSKALQDGDDVQANKILQDLTARLIRFLQIHMRAQKTDAQDCVQQSLELALDVIRKDKLNDPEKMLTYLMITCKNIYLKELEKKREVNYDHVPNHHFHEPNQFKSLVDKERKKILIHCLSKLKERYRRFIDYWFDHPDADAGMAAAHFDISINSAWTRKHRILRLLNECFQKKIKF